MKNVFGGGLVAAFLATGAVAGSPVFEVPESAVVVETAAMAGAVTDWSGFYAGATGSFVTGGTGTYLYPFAGDSYDLSGPGYGGFGGYNIQRGRFVFGGEVVAQAGTAKLANLTQAHFTYLVDAKARAGWAVGKGLVYGFAGYSVGGWANLNEANTAAPAGLNYGAGVDYRITERLFLGAEYIHRDTTGWFASNGNGINPVFDAVQLRLGMDF